MDYTDLRGRVMKIDVHRLRDRVVAIVGLGFVLFVTVMACNDGSSSPGKAARDQGITYWV